VTSYKRTGVVTTRAVPNRGVLGQIQIVVSAIQPNTNTNSSVNKQIHGFAYFDKYHAAPMLMLLYSQMISYCIFYARR